MKLEQDYLEFLMSQALEQAKIAFENGEVPIGAVLGDGSKVIAKAYNKIETLHDPTAHAEALVIREAARQTANWRLSDLVLCSTLEPCTMCCGAIKLSRVPVVVFGAHDSRAGAFGSIYDLSIDARSGLVPRVISGILADESINLLQKFFRERDKKANTPISFEVAAN